MLKRRHRGYTILELVIAVGILSIVIGLIYVQHNRGWKLFNKSFQFGKLQSNARASLEQMAFNIKHSSKDMIYTSFGYNSNVPLPKDYVFGKPYIYFAIPQVKESTPDNPNKKIPTYDYYLYYIAKAKDRDGDFATDRARLKLFQVKNQDGVYTINNADQWPILPPDLIGKANYEDENYVRKVGFVNDIEYQDLTNEFSLYQSEFSFNYFNSNYNNLFKIKAKLIDVNTDSKLEFETAVTPRN